MIQVTTSSAEERDAVIDRAITDGCHAIVTTANNIMIIGDKDLTIAVFQRMVASLSSLIGEKGLVVFGIKDPQDRPCISVLPGTEGAIYVYGVDNDYFLRYINNRDKGLQ